MNQATARPEEQATFQLEDVHCPDCAAAVERTLRATTQITDVQLDWPHNAVRVRYQPAAIDPATIARLITTTGCPCRPAGSGAGDREAASPAAQRWQHLAHAVAVQPITMGTKHDRMQYELPMTPAHDQHSAASIPAPPAGDHAQHRASMGVAAPGGSSVPPPAPMLDHAGHDGPHADHATPSGAARQIENAPPAHPSAPGGHEEHRGHAGMAPPPGGAADDHAMSHAAPAGGHGGHGGMDHDMSDPGMAATMERDIRSECSTAQRRAQHGRGSYGGSSGGCLARRRRMRRSMR